MGRCSCFQEDGHPRIQVDPAHNRQLIPVPNLDDEPALKAGLQLLLTLLKRRSKSDHAGAFGDASGKRPAFKSIINRLAHGLIDIFSEHDILLWGSGLAN